MQKGHKNFINFNFPSPLQSCPHCYMTTVPLKNPAKGKDPGPNHLCDIPVFLKDKWDTNL